MPVFHFFSSKQKINNAVDGIWLIPNFATNDECNAIIHKIESSGFKPARQYKEGRHNKEAFMAEDEIAVLLLSKFSKIILKDGNDKLNITQFSKPLEFYKYEEGDFIKRHSDAPREISPGIFSSLTLVLYLNDDYAGGETFFNEKNYKTKPQTGAVLIFKQALHHEALMVNKGMKYVLRTNCFLGK